MCFCSPAVQDPNNETYKKALEMCEKVGQAGTPVSG